MSLQFSPVLLAGTYLPNHLTKSLNTTNYSSNDSLNSTASKLTTFSKEFGELCSDISQLSRAESRIENDSNEQFYGAVLDTVRAIISTWRTLQISGPENDDEDEATETHMSFEELSCENDSAFAKALELNVTELTQSVACLAGWTTKGRDEITVLICSSSEISGRAQSLKSRLEDAKTEIEGEVTIKDRGLKNAINAYNARKRDLAEAEAELKDLEEKLEERKDNRALLRAGRVAAWGTSLFLPGLLPIAIGMELAAKKLGERIKVTKERKRSCESSMRDAKFSMASRETQVATLRTTAARARALVQDCAAQVNESEWIVERCNDSTRRLAALEAAANNLVRKVKPLRDRTEVMKDLGVDRRMLKEAAGEFTGEVYNGGRFALMEICEPLIELFN